MVENLGHIVNGKSMHDSGAPIEIFDPSNGRLFQLFRMLLIKQLKTH